MKFFKNVQLAPPDPILGLNAAFVADMRKEKVNLGVGAYKTEKLKPLVLKAVREAEEKLCREMLDKEYLPIDGEKQFLKAITSLVLGDSAQERGLFVTQTIGGAGALRLGGRFLVEQISNKIYLSTPTWDNHQRIFTHAGGVVEYYPYYSQEKKDVDFPSLIAFVSKMEKGSILVLHGCCHNPTGCDLNDKQWQELSEIMQERSLFPFFDFAYQGFGQGLEEDARAVRHFVKAGHECLIAVSFSKNFGLYGERVGALFAVGHDQKSADCVGTQLKVLIRGLYSNPPLHGARIIATILQDEKLRKLWMEELQSMRQRIAKMRIAFVEELRKNGLDFEFLKQEIGMFCYTGIPADAVEQMRREFALFLPLDGRISLPGLNHENIPYVVKAIKVSLSK